MAGDQDFIPYNPDETPDFIPYGAPETHYSEQEAVQNRPTKSASFNIPLSSSEMIGQGDEDLANNIPGATLDTAKLYARKGPEEIGGGLTDIAHGDVARGIHRSLSGASVTALPAVLSGPLIAAPGATLLGAGTSAAAKIASRPALAALGATPDQAEAGSDALSIVAGMGGSKLGPPMAKFGSQFRYEPGESINLPWYLGGGKIFRDAPPPSIEDLPYEERGEALMRREAEQAALDRAARTPDDIARDRLNQKVASISAEVRAGLRPSPEEEIQSVLGKEFTAGRNAAQRVPQDIPPPRTPTPTFVPKGTPGATASARPSVAPTASPAANPDVLLAPIKGGPFPNSPRGNIQNVPRDLLPEIIQRTGDPAAVAEFSRTTNKPALFVPESISGGPRESTSLTGLPKIQITEDQHGVRWASSPVSPNPVSIPKSITDSDEIQDYATRKLQEQSELMRRLRARWMQ